MGLCPTLHDFVNNAQEKTGKEVFGPPVRATRAATRPIGTESTLKYWLILVVMGKREAGPGPLPSLVRPMSTMGTEKRKTSASGLFFSRAVAEGSAG